MQLFLDEYTRVDGDIIIPIIASVPVCYKCLDEFKVYSVLIF